MGSKILVADDSIGTRGIVMFTLRRDQHECVEAVDGLNALEKLQRESVDMVVTDYWMPNMTGLELVKAIRADRDLAHLPVLVVTTDTADDRKSELREAGATGCIAKPFTPEDLLGAVRRML